MIKPEIGKKVSFPAAHIIEDQKPQEVEEAAAMRLSIDVSGINWQRSNRAGGGPAGTREGWAWSFAYTKDGGIRREIMQLVQALEQYGKVRVGKYEITLGGRDGLY